MRATKKYNILIGDEIYTAEFFKNHFHYGRGWIIKLPGINWFESDPSVQYMKRSVRKEFPKAKFELVHN